VADLMTSVEKTVANEILERSQVWLTVK
jgi:hypothetical protein